MKKKLLLHVCCGPCSTHCIKELAKEYDLTMYFYNPNIHPYGEYEKRLANGQIVSDSYAVKMEDGDYDVNEWLESIKGFEEEPEGGKRCTICFNMRLKRAAMYAKEHGFHAFTTTMTISPHKDSKRINELGEALARQYDVLWVHSDFKENDGFAKSLKLTKELGLYRQKYCGCFYSVNHSKNKTEKPKS